MKPKYTVVLTSQERENIHSMANSRTVSKTIKNRAKILLLADNAAGTPIKQKEIATRCGVSDVTVYNTLKDFNTYGLEYTLKFKRTKATNPPIVTGEIEARIIALASGDPPKGFTRWTIRLLTQKVMELNILDTISRETIRNTLKKHNIRLQRE